MSRGNDIVETWACGLTVGFSQYRDALAELIDAELEVRDASARFSERREVLILLGMGELMTDPSDERLRAMRYALEAGHGS